jgi:hypothetical protein
MNMRISSMNWKRDDQTHRQNAAKDCPTFAPWWTRWIRFVERKGGARMDLSDQSGSALGKGEE